MSKLRAHLDRLEDWLRSLPGAPAWSSVRFVEAASIRRGPVELISRGEVYPVEVYEERFELHCAAGYGWINLSGLGVDEGALIVSVELPTRAEGLVPPEFLPINLSGPPLDRSTGLPDWALGKRLRIID